MAAWSIVLKILACIQGQSEDRLVSLVLSATGIEEEGGSMTHIRHL